MGASEGDAAAVGTSDGDGAGAADPTLPRRLRARRLKVVGIGLTALLLPVLLWGLVIPRTDVTVTVWFNEGMLNAINVDSKVSNGGTLVLQGLEVSVEVFNASDRSKANLTH